MPVLAQIRERFEKERPLQGHPDRGLPARDDRDGEPDGDARGGRRRGGARAPRIRSRPRTTWPPRSSSRAASRPSRSRARTHDTYYKHINAVLDLRPADHDGRRRRPGQRAPHAARRPADATSSGGTEETTTGVIRLRAMAADGALGYPIVARERRRHQAPVRQPVRHRPVDDRRDHARDEPSARRPDDRGRAATGCAAAGSRRGARHGRARDRHRGRPHRRARGRDGGVPGACRCARPPGSATCSSP